MAAPVLATRERTGGAAEPFRLGLRGDNSFYVPWLDGLRALAALAVLFAHSTPLPGWFGSRVQPFLGSFGVYVFLILSAFLLSRLLVLEQAREGRVDLFAFWIRRALRIWPLYGAFGIFAAIAAFATAVQPAREVWGLVLAHFTFIEDVTMAYWGWSASLPFSEQLWTISLEEQAYFLLPLLLAAYFGARHPPSLRAVVIAAAGIGAAARCAMLLLGAGHTMIWASPLHPDGFLAGVYLGVATTVAADGARRHALGYVSIAAALAALFVLMVTGPPLQYAPAEVYGYPVYALAGAALIVGIANLPLLAGTLALRPLRYLGKVSFGIYVFHALALALAESLLRRADAMSPLAHFLLGAAIAIAFAAGSYHLFERRFLALKTRFAKIRSRPV